VIVARSSGWKLTVGVAPPASAWSGGDRWRIESVGLGIPTTSRTGRVTDVMSGAASGVPGPGARVRFPASSPKSVAEVDDAAAEAVLVDASQIGVRVGRQSGVAPTADDWPDEQGELVDQPRDERLRRGVRTTDQQIPTGGGLQVEYRAGVEVAFEPRFAVGGAARVEE
jgi:hypothetical protein